MQDPGRTTYEPEVAPPQVEDRVVEGPMGTTYAGARPFAYRAPGETILGENVLEVRDRVRWGPIAAGTVTALGSMALLTVLGIALGASVLDRNAPGEDISTWAAVWGAGSAIVSFFLGGWVAAKSAAVGGAGTGMLNGLIAGFAALALIIWLTSVGLGNVFGTIGAGIDDISNAIIGTTPDQATTEDLRATLDEVEDAAWATLAALVLPLVAAALGGWLGHNERRDLIEGTR